MLVKTFLQLTLCTVVLVGAGCSSAAQQNANSTVEENNVAAGQVTGQEAGGLRAAAEVMGDIAESSTDADIDSQLAESGVEASVAEQQADQEADAQIVAQTTESTETAEQVTEQTSTVQDSGEQSSQEQTVAPQETTQQEQSSSPVKEETVQEQEVKQISVSVAVVTPQGERNTYNVKIEEGETVEAAMQKARSKGFSYSARQFGGMGTYVEAINGTKEGGGLYWVFYVNNTPAVQGISTYTLEDGDEVLWKFRAPGAPE